MNTKKRLNCYVFSNLIISFLSLNLLVNDKTMNLVETHSETGTILNRIYEKETLSADTSSDLNNNVTTIVVTNKIVQSKNTINYVKPSYNSITGSALVEYSKHYLGLRYVSGGNSLTTGTDCSGFTKLIYQEFGINLGRTVNSQIYSGNYVSKADLKPGDLIFYGNTSNYASHVGIYMGSGLVIHESNPRDGVKISPVNMMVYITARRLITENVVSDNLSNDKPLEEINKEDSLNDSNLVELNKDDSKNNDSSLEENKQVEETNKQEESNLEQENDNIINNEIIDDNNESEVSDEIKEEIVIEDTKEQDTEFSEVTSENKNEILNEEKTTSSNEVNDDINNIEEVNLEDIIIE